MTDRAVVPFPVIHAKRSRGASVAIVREQHTAGAVSVGNRGRDRWGTRQQPVQGGLGGERYGGRDSRWLIEPQREDASVVSGYFADGSPDAVTLTLAGDEGMRVPVRWDEIARIGLSRA